MYKSPTEIHIVTAPRKAAGVVDVEVAAPGVPKAVMKNGFRYDAVPAPTISSVSPNRGGTGGGTELSITGQNFLKESVVLVDGKPVAKVKFIDKANLELKMPTGADGKMVDVAVRNPDGKEAVRAGLPLRRSLWLSGRPTSLTEQGIADHVLEERKSCLRRGPG